MLRVAGVSKAFGPNQVLNGVNLALEPHSINALIGPSGGGKSVLMKIIGKVSKPDQGTVDYGGISYERISLMFQEGALFDSLNVFDNVAFPLVQGRVPTTILPKHRQLEVHERVAFLLGRVGLMDAIYKMPAQLSGGMRRRVSLARALCPSPELLLLDDPTFGLDPIASSVIMNLIVELHRESRPTTLMVSHDLRRLLPVVDNIFALFDGKIRYAGNLEGLRTCSNEYLSHFVSCRYDFKSIVNSAP